MFPTSHSQHSGTICLLPCRGASHNGLFSFSFYSGTLAPGIRQLWVLQWRGWGRLLRSRWVRLVTTETEWTLQQFLACRPGRKGLPCSEIGKDVTQLLIPSPATAVVVIFPECCPPTEWVFQKPRYFHYMGVPIQYLLCSTPGNQVCSLKPECLHCHKIPHWYTGNLRQRYLNT